MPRVVTLLKTYGSLVKFSHTVFALPFALSMLVVVDRAQPVSAWQLVWILIAIVSARTAAMTFNRLVDRDLDALNPRTKDRELPAGKLSVAKVRLLLVFSSALFFGSAYALGTHCLVAAPLVLGILFFYSWSKRFTSLSHVVLGVSLALAPGGVWYALTAQVALLPLLLMAAVILWVAGFDILYSCQDVAFDTGQHLFSLPARIGTTSAVWAARVLHAAAAALLCAFSAAAGFGWPHYLGLAVFAAILFSQHLLISPGNLSRIDTAFFTRNGAASLVYFIAVLIA